MIRCSASITYVPHVVLHGWAPAAQSLGLGLGLGLNLGLELGVGLVAPARIVSYMKPSHCHAAQYEEGAASISRGAETDYAAAITCPETVTAM